MSKADEAVSSFLSGFNCAQSVFATYCKDYDLDPDIALRISTSFGGGMAHIGETCGAVTGALMLIGLKHGRTKVEDAKAKEENSALVQKFAKRFMSIHGSLKCTNLLGEDLSTEEGLKNAISKNLSRSVCPKYIKDSALILEEIINESRSR